MTTIYEEVRNSLALYTHYMDAGDFAAMGRLFGDARVYDVNGKLFANGAEELEHFWLNALHLYDGTPRTQHVTTNIVIDVAEDGRSAEARSTAVVFQAAPDQPLQPIVTGGYIDRFAYDENDVLRWIERHNSVNLVGHISRHLRRD